jgi:L-ascorbate metabolism protein UlaG (beta-lactamase superfamily)
VPRIADHVAADHVAITTPHRPADDDALEKRVVARVEALYPKEGARIHRRMGEIDLQVLNLHHGRGRNPPVENLGFLLQLGGLKLLHIGDTEANRADFHIYSLADESIDVAFLPGESVTFPSASEESEAARAPDNGR